MDKKPEELGHGVTMEEVQEVFFKGTTEEALRHWMCVLI